MNRSTPLIIASSLLLAAACTGHGNMEYTNVAKYHPAWHSSAVDYDNTAQLITDGLVEDGAPSYYTMEVNGEEVLKENLAWIFDYREFTGFKVDSSSFDLIVRFNGMDVVADRLDFVSRGLSADGKDAGTEGSVDVMVTGDGSEWTSLGEKGNAYTLAWSLPSEMSLKGIRIVGKGEYAKWEIRRLRLFLRGGEVDIYKKIRFHSCWVSGGASSEWVYVDLGRKTDFDRLTFHWINRPLSGDVLVSDDAANWRKIADYAGEDTLSVKGSARYVKLQMGAAADGGRLALSEMEIWGWREPEAVESDWWLVREDLKDIPDAWVPAKVPCTVLAAYIDAGMLPDPSYADNVCQISDSYFKYNFIYRGVMQAPESLDGRTWLNFDGVNWKADVKFNGEFVGHIDGAFIRSQFDVTGLIHEGPNDVEVLVYCPANPSCAKGNTYKKEAYNGGILGADNPTFHASVGWDWIPTVRGRNIGIWNDVFLTAHAGGVTIDDVFVDTDLPLPSTDYADLKPVVTLTNHAAQPQQAEISLRYGELQIDGSAALAAGETRDIALAPARLERPELWWPAGYGEPHLYDVQATVSVGGTVSDSKQIKSGVREMSYTMDGGVLDFYVNGRRLIGNGGNWGYPEIDLAYRAREYDIAAAYHADMHFTMIRNWVGMTGDDEFWEACDRHGVMVWQDFWLANPADGPDPFDEAMFLANAEDFLRKIRHHPSLALYCGRNEGNPPAALDAGLAALVERLHPGMQYIPHSADGPVSGGGPYRALPVKEYFSMTRGADRFHSERGMPNVPTLESLQRMLGPAHQWPQDNVWGMHDYALESAQSAATFNAMVQKLFGEPKDLEQFSERAQWIDYDGYRAIFEARSAQRKGIQLWMSHSCWPSMVWQTYDYYFAPTAAYFGAKKGSAPIRIQWNPYKEQVEVVNNNAGDLAGLTAQIVVASPDGSVLSEQTAVLDAPEDSTVPVAFEIPGQAGDDEGKAEDDGGQAGDDGGKVLPDLIGNPILLRLRLVQDDCELADNFYALNPADPGNLQALLQMPEAKVGLKYSFRREGEDWVAVATLENRSKTPALMLRLNLVGARSGEQILPVFYEDNWVSLLPGERKELTVRCAAADTRGERPTLQLSGFNLH
jgi:hypothetical protein